MNKTDEFLPEIAGMILMAVLAKAFVEIGKGNAGFFTGLLNGGIRGRDDFQPLVSLFAFGELIAERRRRQSSVFKNTVGLRRIGALQFLGPNDVGSPFAFLDTKDLVFVGIVRTEVPVQQPERNSFQFVGGCRVRAERFVVRRIDCLRIYPFTFFITERFLSRTKQKSLFFRFAD